MTREEAISKHLQVVRDVSDGEDDAIEKILVDGLKKEHQEDDFKDFERLDDEFKLERLQKLVQQSQVFSNIISDTLLESSLMKKKEAAKEEEEPPKKKARSTRRSKRGSKVTDFFVKKEVTDETMATKEKLDQAGKSSSIKQPSLVTGGVMRDYQLEGTEWLITLYENGLNGILADEMGLGKTLQCIGLLAFLYEQGIKGPFLVTAPLSTVGNWVKEIERFAPALPVLGYVGLKENRKELRQKHYGKNGFREAIVVTSYETVLRDFEFFGKTEWKFLIVDEGHRLKNVNCKLIRELKKLKTQNRLLLTGTPLQNNLDELWSLLNFILPDIFHDLELFQKWFDFSSLTDLKKDTDDSTKKLIDTKIQETLVDNLHTILKPFLLRRLKKTVLKNLVWKKEFIIYGSLTPDQDRIYKAALSKLLRKEVLKFALKERVEALKLKVTPIQVDQFINDQLEGAKYERTKEDHEHYLRTIAKESHFLSSDLTPLERKLHGVLNYTAKWVDQKRLNNLMMQLRLICNSPYLFYYPWDDEADMTLDKLLQTSSKLQILEQLVPRLVKEGHKVLIFCQFTSMMAFVQDWCDFNAFGYCYLDGSTGQAEREENIEMFKCDKEKKIFILSTRAGGLGLNLTAADSVILLDSDWNPQVDLQAMDRVHRIGQEKPVAVYRVVIANTIEEVILAKADAKRKLERVVIEMGQFQNLRRLMKQDNAVFASKHKREEDMDLAAELKTLYEDDRFSGLGKTVKDNTLTNEELDVLVDRSDESYLRPPEFYAKFQHIQFFETSSSFE
jgi:ATP-dependent DNA helicase